MRHPLGRLTRSRLTKRGIENRRTLIAAGQASDSPRVTYAVRHKVWVLMEEFWYYDAPSGIIFRIPRGFRFDLSSVPRLAWPVIAPFELSIAAPLVHDYITRYAGKMPDGTRIERVQADVIFLRIMRSEDVPAWRRCLAWPIVRAFGWWPWMKNTMKENR